MEQTFGKYQLLKKLATGGMSELWLARRVSERGGEQELAVKRLPPHLAPSPLRILRFLNEMRIVSSLSHKNIVAIYDCGAANDSYFIAMEYIRGENLGRVMQKAGVPSDGWTRAWNAGQWISPPVAMSIMSECLEALACVHSKSDHSGKPLKVVHRNIAPQSILIGFDGTVKLVGFGIAMSVHTFSTDQRGVFPGKLTYMSPEQAMGKPLDHHTDIFSAGLVLYELLTGRRPLQRSSKAATNAAAKECRIDPPSEVSESPPELDAVVMKALAKSPGDRYPDADAFKRAIAKVCAHKKWDAGTEELSELMKTLFHDRLMKEGKQRDTPRAQQERNIYAGAEGHTFVDLSNSPRASDADIGERQHLVFLAGEDDPLPALDDEPEYEEDDAESTRAGPPRKLVFIDGPDKGMVKRFVGVRMVFGRTDNCTVVLQDKSVSRRHLELVQGARGVLLRDLGSGNGTKVNGERHDEKLLHHEDIVEIGQTRFQLIDEMDAARQTKDNKMAAGQPVVAAPQPLSTPDEWRPMVTPGSARSAPSIFISYARSSSAMAARDLKLALGESAFLDTTEIKPGERFPPALLHALLESRVVVVFAETTYFERWYCLRELETVLQPFLRASGDAAQRDALGHVVVVLPPDQSASTLDHLPPELRNLNWPSSGELQQQVRLVQKKLSGHPPTLAERIAAHAGTRREEVLHELLERAAKPPPQNLASSSLPLYPASFPDSLQDGFIGRSDELARIHFALSTARGTAASAALTGSIEGIGGMGKTRLALEYVHRYGPRHFPGGIFWVDADCSDEALKATFHGILCAIQSKHQALVTEVLQRTVPSTFQEFLQESRDARHELAQVLHALSSHQPILYVVDNVPEPALTEAAPKPLDTWCPARQKVALLVTSRQNLSAQGGIQGLAIEELPAGEAVQLLTCQLRDRGALSPDQWLEIVNWVGGHPMALDLLNQVLRRGSGSEAAELLRATREQGPTSELDERMQGLVKAKVALPHLLGTKREGIRRAFSISFDKLSEPARRAARLVARLAPSVIPNALIQEMGSYFSPAVCIELTDRHFVVPAGANTGNEAAMALFGSMHRLMADYLQAGSPAPNVDWARVARALTSTLARARAERNWALAEPCALHALHVWRGRAPAPAESRKLDAEFASVLSNVLGLLGRQDETLEAIQGAVEAYRQLSLSKPIEFDHHLATSLNDLSKRLSQMKRPEDALRASQDAVEIYERLSKARPEKFEPDLAISLNNLSAVLFELGRREEGLKASQDAVEVYERLAAARPETFAQYLALSRDNLSFHLKKLGDRDRRSPGEG